MEFNGWLWLSIIRDPPKSHNLKTGLKIKPVYKSFKKLGSHKYDKKHKKSI